MNEKIKDIIREMRKKADQADFACCGNVDATFVRVFADRIEAAYSRERQDVPICKKSCRECGELLKQIVDENTKLRSLVKGLLEAATIDCVDCDYDCGQNRENCIVHEAAKYIEGMEVTE